MGGIAVKINKGDVFGRLKTTGEIFSLKGSRMIECLCECGKTKNCRISRLVSGACKSCGCLHKELASKRLKTHGLTSHPLFKTHAQMIRRCENEKDQAYHNYGKKGVKVCEEWKVLENFIKWANNNGWSKHLTIERNNSNGNYEPSNCRWATRKEQARNISTNVYIKFEGKETLLLDLADRFNIRVDTLRMRIKRKGIDFLIQSLTQTK